MPAQNLDYNYVYVQRKLLFYNWVITKKHEQAFNSYKIESFLLFEYLHNG
jgi:hypothetical protein